MELKYALTVICAGVIWGNPSTAQDTPQLRFPASTYGTPGLIDMPTGEVFPDGTVHTSIAYHDGSQRYTASFQLSPRIFGTFRYAIIDSLDGGDGARFDRSFDLGYLLAEEQNWRPSIVVGLRDFGGTGVYGSEYVAATKHLMQNRLAITGGIGWGRLGSYGSFSNPLSVLSDGFDRRSFSTNDTGQLDLDQWFRGDAALFGGLAYQINPRLTFKAEYSSDAYVVESENAGFEHNTPINLGLTYNFDNGNQISAYALHGSEIGFTADFPITPQQSKFVGGIESAPPALLPRQTAAALSWNPQDVRTQNSALRTALQDQGIDLEGLSVEGSTATVRIANGTYNVQAQALGRTARVLANSLPSNITTFEIESTTKGIPTSSTKLRRGDLEALEYDLEGSWRSFARAEITDARRSEAENIAGVYPKFQWEIGPYLEPSLFDPDNPVRADFGVEAKAAIEPARGLVFSGTLRQPLLGNLDESTRESNSVIQRVRTDSVLYTIESDLAVTQLTAEYFFRPGKDLFGRVSAGYLESMYGGVSAEVLWRPVDSPLALGIEANYAKQRDFDQLFGFQDYDVFTGHASAYYDFGGGYLGQIDAGRYLAGDYGATFSLDREFNNGFKVGAFFTLTDVPFEDFGEGSFDKGIRFSIPTSWLAGEPSQDGFGTTIRPVLRDGGARLSVPNRLFGLTRDSHTLELEDGWARFWR